eukprot:3116895-Rhodomonas_salina.1
MPEQLRAGFAGKACVGPRGDACGQDAGCLRVHQAARLQREGEGARARTLQVEGHPRHERGHPRRQEDRPGHLMRPTTRTLAMSGLTKAMAVPGASHRHPLRCDRLQGREAQAEFCFLPRPAPSRLCPVLTKRAVIPGPGGLQEDVWHLVEGCARAGQGEDEESEDDLICAHVMHTRRDAVSDPPSSPPLLLSSSPPLLLSSSPPLLLSPSPPLSSSPSDSPTLLLSSSPTLLSLSSSSSPHSPPFSSSPLLLLSSSPLLLLSSPPPLLLSRSSSSSPLLFSSAPPRAQVYNAKDACTKLGVDGMGLDKKWSQLQVPSYFRPSSSLLPLFFLPQLPAFS